MRKLASIQKIEWIEPIEGRDRIELAGILGWQVIVKKGEFNVGDWCVYVEIDSKLPETEDFEFLRPKKFVIKTMKMGGVLSQGIAFPMSILPQGRYNFEDDVTEVLGITKYEKYVDDDAGSVKAADRRNIRLLKYMMRYKVFRVLFGRLAKGLLTKKERDAFPAFIAKTDETRIQNIPRVLCDKEARYVVTEKVDGTSATYFLTKTKSLFGGEKLDFGVCSRNRRLFDKSEKLYDGCNGNPDNWTTLTSDVYWRIAYKHNIRAILERYMRENNFDWCGMQGEIIGPKIQGNKYKVTEPRFFMFNLLTPSGMSEYVPQWMEIECVPIVGVNVALPDTVNEVLDYATGQSKINPETLREGVVIRNYDKNISFKAVSPEFLLKYND